MKASAVEIVVTLDVYVQLDSQGISVKPVKVAFNNMMRFAPGFQDIGPFR